MRSSLKIALIPAYNPESCLLELTQKLKEKGFWILIVDDGSDSRHKIIFQEIEDAERILILTHKKIKGKEEL